MRWGGGGGGPPPAMGDWLQVTAEHGEAVMKAPGQKRSI